MTRKRLLKTFSCAIFFYLVFNVVESANFMPVEHWVCGATEMDQSLAYQSANETCYDVGVDLNECCKVHDDCYGGENTQEACDVPFCECLAKQAARSKFRTCKSTAENFCLIVQLLGGLAHKRDECIDEASFDLCNLAFKSCLSTKPSHICEEMMCQCAAASLIDPFRAECRTGIDKVCKDPSLFLRVSERAESVLLKEVDYFGYSMTVVAACGATLLVLCVFGLVVGLVYRYMTKKTIPSSPSRTPLCAAASSDLTLIFNTNAGLLPEDEERKPTMLYP